MENQEIKEKQPREKCPRFTEQEDLVIRLAFENTKGSIWDRSVVASKAINKSVESITNRYYYLVSHGKMEKIDMPRKHYEWKKKKEEVIEEKAEEKIEVVEEMREIPQKARTPRKKKEVVEEKPIQEVKAPSKWRRIMDILFNK